MKWKELMMDVHLGNCLAPCLMKLKMPWMGYALVPLLSTMLDETEEAMDGLALGPLFGTMLDKAEGDSKGLALGPLLGMMLDETEWSWMDLHWAITLHLAGDEMEGANDGRALGQLLGTMLDEIEDAMDGLCSCAITWHLSGCS
jgi:hypothetical protein